MTRHPRAIVITVLQAWIVLLAAASPVFSDMPLTSAAITPDMDPRFKFYVDSFKNERFKKPTGIFVDREHAEVYVTDGGRSELLLFDIDGGFIHRFGKRDGIASPIDVVVKGDRIYLSQDNKSYIQVLSYLGKPLKRLTPPSVDFMPGRMELADDGRLYVVNKARSNVVVFDEDDAFVGVIGEGLSSVGGLAVGGGVIYLIKSFSTSSVIHKYSTDGEKLREFEALGGRGGTLSLPITGKVDGRGNLWLLDAMLGVVIYGQDDKKVTSFKDILPGSEVLQFPIDIDFGKDGMVYLLEQGAKRFTVFK